MLTKEDVEQIGNLIHASEKRLTEKIESVDLKVEASHEFNKKAHAQIMETLLDIGEINYSELKKEIEALKKRIEQLETRRQN